MAKKGKDAVSDGGAGRLRIAVGGDHHGYRLKEHLVMSLREDRHSVKDHGVHNSDPCDYPDITEQVARAVLAGEADLGVIVASSGAGAAIAGNKIAGVRAIHAQDTYTARQGRRSLDANLLTLGSRVVGQDLALEIVRAWLAAEFSGDERAVRLVQRIERLEDDFDADRAAPRGRTVSSDT